MDRSGVSDGTIVVWHRRLASSSGTLALIAPAYRDAMSPTKKAPLR
jgi:hypothetical protein